MPSKGVWGKGKEEMDTVERTETYLLKSGAQGRWSEAPKETFDFVVNRNKERATG